MVGLNSGIPFIACNFCCSGVLEFIGNWPIYHTIIANPESAINDHFQIENNCSTQWMDSNLMRFKGTNRTP